MTQSGSIAGLPSATSANLSDILVADQLNSAFPSGFTTRGLTIAQLSTLIKRGILLSVFDFMTEAQINDVIARTGLIDVTAALNTAFAFGSDNKVGIYIPGGRYKITSTLWATPVGSTQQSCYIIGAGRGFSSTAQTVIDATALTNVPALVIQYGRGCYVGKFTILGGNFAPVALPVTSMLYGAAWVTGGLRDDRYSPHCGLSIDAGLGSTPPGGGYPGFTYRGSGAGSSDVAIDVGVWNFVVGIMHNSEIGALEGDQIQIINPQIQYCKVPIAIGQSQADACTIWGGNLGNCRSCVDTQEYGQQQGHPPLLIGTQYGPAFECFSFGGSFGIQQLVGGRCESVHRIGQIGIGASSSSYPLLLDGFDCHLLNQTTFPQTRCPIVLESASSPVEWIGGGLDDGANGAPSYVLTGQPLTIRGALINMANRFRPFIGGAIDFQFSVELRNCRVFDTTNAVIYGNESRQFSLSGRFSAHWSEGKIRDANNLYQYQPGAGNNYINIGATSAFVFSSTQLTFNNNDPAGLVVGDLIMWRFNAVGKSVIQITAPAAQITGIVGNAVTCSLLYPLSYYDQTYNPSTTSVVVNEWATAPGQVLTGNINGTTALSGVSPTTILQNGDWIAATGIPANTRVASGGGTVAITLSRAATATQTGVKLGYGGLKRIDADTIGADNGDASVDLNPRQDAIVQLWNTPLTAARSVSLASFINFPAGSRFRIIRGGAATGGFNLNIGTGPIKALTAAGQWCDVAYNGATGLWFETASGTL